MLDSNQLLSFILGSISLERVSDSEYDMNNKPLNIISFILAKFDNKNIIDPNGFRSNKYKKRGGRVEWEHVVPAENFGRSFVEWREGHPECVTKKVKAFK